MRNFAKSTYPNIQFILDICTYEVTSNENLLTIPNFYLGRIKQVSNKELTLKLLDTLVKLNAEIKYESNPKYMVLSTLLLF